MIARRDVDWTELSSAVAELGTISDAAAAGALIVDSCHRALGATSTALWLGDGSSGRRLVAAGGRPADSPHLSVPEPLERALRRGSLLQTRDADGAPVCAEEVTSIENRLVVTYWARFAPDDHLGVARLGALEVLFSAGAAAVSRAVSSRPTVEAGRLLQRDRRSEIHPGMPGEAAARCAPAGDGSQIGGDWFDVVRTPDGRTVLVVGDVVGHGVGAAVEMSGLRAVLRSHLLGGLPAGVALARLNDLVHDRGGFATCCCVEIGPRGTTVASAGHPPPIVAGTNEHATICAVGPGPPLGAVAGAVYPTRRIELRQGDAIVLYSDGLVEQRGATIHEGIRRLRRAVAHAATSDPDELADHLLGLAGPRHLLRDDVAVLAYRPTGRPKGESEIDDRRCAFTPVRLAARV